MHDLLDALREFDALREADIVQTGSLPAIPPQYGDGTTIQRLSGEIQTALKGLQIDQLYAHQEEAVSQALDGKNVVLQAPTASGKTLAFQLPMLDSLVRDPGSHALMIYPVKALSRDQRDQLMKLIEQVPNRRIEAWWYNGDTDRETRKVLRKKPPRILITTPEMVNSTFLAYSDLWDRFLSGLRWVIVDEMHEYRGYFGSNVSLLLRRFAFHLEKRGVRPQFFLCSATCNNAKEHAENLTGLDFVEVNAAESIRPAREFAFIDPRPSIPDFEYWEILRLRVVNAALACLHAGKSLLVFCPTRKFAENCVGRAKREIERLRNDLGVSLDPETVSVFRDGLSVKDREDILASVKHGDVRLVFTTNALELGLDIGGLDGVILAGFPENTMSAWQQIGRAGRNWQSQSFALYYPRNNPLDTFYASNLTAFLQKPFDDLVASADNEELIQRHVPALLFETNDLAGGAEILDNPLYVAAKAEQQSGATPDRSTRYRHHQTIDLRGPKGQQFTVKGGDSEIGTLSGKQKFREAYLNAIYLHGGKRYRVKAISLGGSENEITVDNAKPYLRTDPILTNRLIGEDIYAGNRWSRNETMISTYYGKVQMIEEITAVNEIDERSGEVIDRWEPSENRVQSMHSHAYWICLETEDQEMAGAFVTLQHLLRIGALFTIPLDAHDVGPHCDIKGQKAYLVENYPGGIGIARKALENWRDILQAGVGIAKACSCARGCPNCVLPPRSKDDIDKVQGIALAERLMHTAQGPPQATFESGLWKPTKTEELPPLGG